MNHIFWAYRSKNSNIIFKSSKSTSTTNRIAILWLHNFHHFLFRWSLHQFKSQDKCLTIQKGLCASSIKTNIAGYWCFWCFSFFVLSKYCQTRHNVKRISTFNCPISRWPTQQRNNSISFMVQSISQRSAKLSPQDETVNSVCSLFHMMMMSSAGNEVLLLQYFCCHQKILQ